MAAVNMPHMANFLVYITIITLTGVLTIILTLLLLLLLLVRLFLLLLPLAPASSSSSCSSSTFSPWSSASSPSSLCYPHHHRQHDHEHDIQTAGKRLRHSMRCVRVSMPPSSDRGCFQALAAPSHHRRPSCIQYLERPEVFLRVAKHPS